MHGVVPHAPIKKWEFAKQPAIEINAGQAIDGPLMVRIVGKANVEHLKWVVGNYWETTVVKLDNDKLFNELRKMFRSKRKAKRTMNETREEICQRVIDSDWEAIWTTFQKKIDRAIWRHPKTRKVLPQVVQLQLADLVIEENSECTVDFRGKTYTVEVEGRRAIVGEFYATNGDRVRVMGIKNRFIGRTFWQTQGRAHVVRNTPGLFDDQQ